MEFCMDNSYTNTFMPSGIPQQDAQNMNPVFQNINAQQQYLNQQLAQNNQLAHPQGQHANYTGLNPLAMASMLRQGANGTVTPPDANYAPMSGVSGMGNSMGTGINQDQYNSGIGFNPSAQVGGYGIK